MSRRNLDASNVPSRSAYLKQPHFTESVFAGQLVFYKIYQQKEKLSCSYAFEAFPPAFPVRSSMAGNRDDPCRLRTQKGSGTAAN
jgi:hypothetical protein